MSSSPVLWQNSGVSFKNVMKTSLLLLSAVLTFAAAAPSKADEPKLTGLQVYEKGKAALERGNLPVARQCFERLLKAKPDFELARIQLAQVAVAEREQAKIPRSLKAAKAGMVSRIEWGGATLDDAISTVAKQIEKASAAEKLTVSVTGPLPDAVSSRNISMNVSQVSMDQVLEALGYAGGVRISYTVDGINVKESSVESRGAWDAGNPKLPNMDVAAKKIIIDQIEMKDAPLADALNYLQRKAAEVSRGAVAPVFAVRHDLAPRGQVTLSLRNISLLDAVRSVCLVTEVEEKWFPWGAGIGNRQAPAAVTSPSKKEEAPK